LLPVGVYESNANSVAITEARWRKMKGIARIRDYNGDIYEAEIHWFEAHGVGKRDWKIKTRIE
jgi:hypothetical protein